MLVKVASALNLGLYTMAMEIEVNVAQRGLPAFEIVGLPTKAVAESKQRVRTAIINSNIQFPARRIVVKKRPEIIIGVACERDLTSGIQDSYPVPVFGILNQRPFGPCYDTDVDLELVENGLITFLGYERRKTEGPCPEDVERAGL